MRIWQYWWQTLIISSQQNPPRFIELVMLLLAIFLIASWGITGKWPYLVLSLSYVVGSSISVLIRESITPSPDRSPQLIQLTAVLLLIMSAYALAELTSYL